jgi:hypothetical protein
MYWLSKYGFECARIDHVGIDLIAVNPHTSERMGISVKSRCRLGGTEADCVNLPADNFTKASKTCEIFRLVPYFAIVVDAADILRGFILPMSRLLTICPLQNRGSYWKMSSDFLQKCRDDNEIKYFEFQTKTPMWWTPNLPRDKS